MKIAMVYDAWDIVWWWRTHVENICRQLCQNHGCEIDLFVRKIQGEKIKIFDPIKNLNIIYCWRSKDFFDIIERIRSIIDIIFAVFVSNKKKKYDIIHAHSYLPLISGKLSAMFLWIPVIATIHWANFLQKWIKNISYRLEYLIFWFIKYDKIISVGSYFLKYNFKNTIVIWNGINIEKFNWEKRSNNKYTILFVWRLERTKWVDLLINATSWIILNKLTNRDFCIKIIWYWYDREKYENMVKIFWLSDIIIFEWKKQWEELVRFYKSSDLLIVPSRAEWFGIVILEAMASWIPVLATRSWWPEDIINNHINGVLVDLDEEKIKRELVKFLNNDYGNDFIQKIVENWKNTVEKRYTREIVWNKIYDVYLDLLWKK